MRKMLLTAMVVCLLPVTLGSSCWDDDTGGGGTLGHACPFSPHALSRNIDINLSHFEPRTCPVIIQYGEFLESGAELTELTRPVEANFSSGYVYSQPDWQLQGYNVDSFRFDVWGGYSAQPYVTYQGDGDRLA